MILKRILDRRDRVCLNAACKLKKEELRCSISQYIERR
jgi:hypothetical protein